MDWISVKDRLPEENVPVIVNYIGFASGEKRQDGIAVIKNGYWKWWESYAMVKVEITHWMYLPNPPED